MPLEYYPCRAERRMVAATARKAMRYGGDVRLLAAPQDGIAL